MTIEKREAVETRAEGKKLVGYIATFNNEARISDFHETIKPGAFSASLASGNDILALADHDKAKVLGRTKSGTLRLTEDGHGLRFELDMPDTQAGRDLLALAARNDIGGASFGFSVPEGGDIWNGDKRELRSINLHEVSIVSSWPAYQGTIVQARSRPDDSRARRIRLLELGGK